MGSQGTTQARTDHEEKQTRREAKEARKAEKKARKKGRKTKPPSDEAATDPPSEDSHKDKTAPKEVTVVDYKSDEEAEPPVPEKDTGPEEVGASRGLISLSIPEEGRAGRCRSGIPYRLPSAIHTIPPEPK